MKWSLTNLLLLLTRSTFQSYLNTNTQSVKSYAALGDSYASGGGAGSSKWIPRLDPFCGRFSDAYPRKIVNNTILAIEESNFRNLACGGSTTRTVLSNQVPWISKSDFVTITVGGNEVDFFLLLNECVHQWKPTSTCDEEINKAKTLMESMTFLNNFEKMVIGAMKKLKPEASLLVTGYARFFNDLTTQCDKITFSRTNSTNFLTRDVRKKFNQLITILNNVIMSVTTTHGAIYIDIDEIFEGHRFCEEGVNEPSPLREDTWFFNIDYDDDDDGAAAAAALLDQSGQQGSFNEMSHNPFKDFLSLVRTFHPTSIGHEAIANGIVNKILEI